MRLLRERSDIVADLTFKTSLSEQQIEDNFKNIDFFSGIMEGLEEALEYERGKASAETFAHKQSLPSVNVAEVRASLDMTQKTFAFMLGVSCHTVEAWECGKSTPTPTAKKLIYLIQKNHSLVDELLENQ